MNPDNPKPVMHITINTGIGARITRAMAEAIKFMKEKLDDHYQIIVSPGDAMTISTENNNVVRLDITDKDVAEKFFEILNNEGWRRKEETDDTSGDSDHMA